MKEEVKKIKESIRQRIWTRLERNKVDKFPKPIFGRIPNFLGAEEAAEKLSNLEEFRKAKTIFFNPDSPQRHARFLALKYGKIVIMATPRLRKGFLLLDPRNIPRNKFWEASSIRGAFKYGKIIGVPEEIKIDLKVAGSVAVSPKGGRIGKGGGYSDLEYAILRELNVLDDSTPIATTVHDLQIEEEIPMLKHDVPVDIIVTPSKVIKIREPYYQKPKGIYWEILPKEKLDKIPILNKLRYYHRGIHNV